MMYNDPRLKLTDAQLRERALSVQRGEEDSKVAGMRGYHVFAEMLSYTSYLGLLVAPVAHCLLFGVAADFFEHVFRKVKKPSAESGQSYPADVIKHAQRREIAKMAGLISVPSDFGRGYRCIIKYRCVLVVYICQ